VTELVIIITTIWKHRFGENKDKYWLLAIDPVRKERKPYRLDLRVISISIETKDSSIKE